MGRRLTMLVLAAIGAAFGLTVWTAGSLAQPRPSAQPTGIPDMANGATVYADTCARCHGDNGEGGFTQPALHGMPYGQDTVQAVADVVRNGTDEMDPLAGELSDEEITAVAEYVVSTFGAQGDEAVGGTLFRANCAGCHGAAGRGGALIYSDQNAPSLQDGSNAITVGAIRGGPGTMPPFNQAALDDTQVASIARYVDVLRDPPSPGGLAVGMPGPVAEGLIAGVVGLGLILLAGAWLTRGGRG